MSAPRLASALDRADQALGRIEAVLDQLARSHDDHQRLREEVREAMGELDQLIADMLATMRAEDGAGLAFAPGQFNMLYAFGRGEGAISISGDIAITEFNEGRLPYWITGPWNVAGAQDAGVNLVVEEVPSPGGEFAAPFVGVQGFMISNVSENQLLVNEFVVNYLGTDEVAQQLYDAGGRAPALTSVFESVSDDPIVAGFGEVGANGSPIPNIPAMAAVWSLVKWPVFATYVVFGIGGAIQGTLGYLPLYLRDLGWPAAAAVTRRRRCAWPWRRSAALECCTLAAVMDRSAIGGI